MFVSMWIAKGCVLPDAKWEMAVPMLSSLRSSASGSESEQREPRVLVVDDNEALLSVIRDLLERYGYAVDCAATPVQALEHLTVATPDIILCDIVLPDRTGYELCDEIRCHPEWSQVPVVFLSSLGQREDIRNGYAWGCDGYLAKPFDPDDLLALVRGRTQAASHRSRMAKIQFESYRKRIIHTLSHEFRTPLVSITTGAELLLDQQRVLNPDQTKRLLESIQRGGYRLERLVNDFMMLQQIDLGHASNTCDKFRRRVCLADLVATSIESFQENRPKGNNCDNIVFSTLSSDAATGLANIYDVQIATVIHHLLGNAVKFAGSVRPIEVSVAAQEHELIVRVRDHGPGLQSQFFDKATELFAQIDRETTEQQGAGVGLTIARAFTEINDGTIEFLRPNHGPGLVAELRFARMQD